MLVSPVENRASVDVFPEDPKSGAEIGSEDGSNVQSATTASPPSDSFNASANINVTINDLSGSSLGDLKSLFSSTGGKNLVIYLGHPQVFLSLLGILIGSIMSEWKIVDPSIVSAMNPGMPLNMHGFPAGFFRIRAAGTQHYWALHGGDCEDGNTIFLYCRDDNELKRRARSFFLNSQGQLCTEGVRIDMMDNTLIVTHERPATFPSPNPWSHQPSTFSYSKETRMISVELYADPLISNQWPRPEKEWKDREFVVAARPPTQTRIRRLDELSRWAPSSTHVEWTKKTNSLEANAWNAVGVEEKAAMMKLEDSNRIKWEIEQF